MRRTKGMRGTEDVISAWGEVMIVRLVEAEVRNARSVYNKCQIWRD